MVPTPRRALGLHRVLHIHRHVVSKRNPSAAILFFYPCQMCFLTRSALFLFRGVGCIFYEMITGRPLFPGSTVEDELHLIFRILGEAAHQINASFSALLLCGVLWFCIRGDVSVRAPSFHLQMRSAGTPTDESWPGITNSEEFKTYNFPQYQAEPLVSHAPRHVFEFQLTHLTNFKMHFRILFCTNKHNLAILFLCLALFPVTG